MGYGIDLRGIFPQRSYGDYLLLPGVKKKSVFGN